MNTRRLNNTASNYTLGARRNVKMGSPFSENGKFVSYATLQARKEAEKNSPK